MRIFAGAVREDWKLNGTRAGGRQIPGLTSTSKTIKAHLSSISKKYGCQAGSFTRKGPFSPYALLIVVSLGAVLAYSLSKLLQGWLNARREA